MTPPDSQQQAEELIRRRQRDRARIMAVLLGAFVVLIFFVAIVKIRGGQG